MPRGPCRTTGCRRRQTASARPSLPPFAAPEPQRWSPTAWGEKPPRTPPRRHALPCLRGHRAMKRHTEPGVASPPLPQRASHHARTFHLTRAGAPPAQAGAPWRGGWARPGEYADRASDVARRAGARRQVPWPPRSARASTGGPPPPGGRVVVPRRRKGWGHTLPGRALHRGRALVAEARTWGRCGAPGGVAGRPAGAAPTAAADPDGVRSGRVGGCRGLSWSAEAPEAVASPTETGTRWAVLARRWAAEAWRVVWGAGSDSRRRSVQAQAGSRTCAQQSSGADAQ
jgi:hypothetical protein